MTQCAFCGSEFSQRRANHWFCGDACRKKYHYWSRRDMALRRVESVNSTWTKDATIKYLTALVERQAKQIDQLMLLCQSGAAAPTRQMPLFQVPASAIDDMPIEKTLAKSEEKPAFNFMISNAKSGLVALESLPREVIEYGVQRGKLSESLLKPVGIKKMAVPTNLAAPTFDDDDDISLLQ